MSIQPIDLHLRVSRLDPHERVLKYHLSSPSGRVEPFHLKGESGRLPADSRDLSGDLLQDLEGLLSGLWGKDTQLLDEEVEKRLRKLGKNLYRRLLPENFRELLEGIDLGEDGSLLIETEEDRIPWELLHTLGPAGDFLCLRYRMGRWATRRNPAHLLQVTQLLCIDAGNLSYFGGSDLAVLPESPLEASLLVGMTQRWPGLGRVPIATPSYEAVMKRLQAGGFQLLHFIGHGDYPEGQSADRAELLLEEQNLAPMDLVDEVERAMQQDRPLVFLNACRAARQGQSLAGLGGWPRTFVELCGCGAFLAPQWSVRGERAYEFAESFYAGLEQGQPLGEAVRQARLPRPQQASSHAGVPAKVGHLDATSLAYALYGHPNASVRWGESEGSIEPPPVDVDVDGQPPADELPPRPAPVSVSREARDVRDESRRQWIWSAAGLVLGLLTFVVLQGLRTSTRVQLELVVDRVDFTVGGEKRTEVIDTSFGLSRLYLSRFSRIELEPSELWSELDEPLAVAGPLTLTARDRGSYVSLEPQTAAGEQMRSLGPIGAAPEASVELGIHPAQGDTLEIGLKVKPAERLDVAWAEAFRLEGEFVDVTGFSADGISTEAQPSGRLFWRGRLAERLITIFSGTAGLKLTATMPADGETQLLGRELPISRVGFSTLDGGEWRTHLRAEGRLSYPDHPWCEDVMLRSSDFLAVEDLKDFRFREIVADPASPHLRLFLDGFAGSVRAGPSRLGKELVLPLHRQVEGPRWLWLVGWLLIWTTGGWAIGRWRLATTRSAWVARR